MAPRWSVLSLFCSLAFMNVALACDCKPAPPPKEALEAAAAVFEGKVLKVAPATERSLAVTFSITRTWKGVAEEKVEVLTGTDDGNCGYKFKVGSTYLVYASGATVDEKTQLSTGICHRTRPVDKADEDFKELGKGKPPE
jgi:hypothetical protein